MANKDQPSTPAQTSDAGKGSGKTTSKAARREAAQAELRRVQLQQRRNRLIWMGTVIVTVVAIFAVVIVFGIMRNSGSGAKTTAATAKLTKTMANIPSSAYDSPSVVLPTNPPVSLNATPMTEGGKPRVLYAGAEYCPFCAAERWAMVSALSRFGTFTGLGETTSSGRDYAPNTPTLSFHGATFSSKYLVFKGYEMQSNQVKGGSYAPLDKLSSADGKLFDKYDFSPYFNGSNAQGAIPFIDFGGKYGSQGASYSPLIFAGLTQQKVADDITDPSTEISKSVLGAANVFTAAICQLTNNQPSNVCTASGVTAAASALPK